MYRFVALYLVLLWQADAQTDDLPATSGLRARQSSARLLNSTCSITTAFIVHSVALLAE